MSKQLKGIVVWLIVLVLMVAGLSYLGEKLQTQNNYSYKELEQDLENHQVSEAVKGERLQQLQAQIDLQQKAFAERLDGRTLPVLFDKPGRLPGQIVGRSPYLQPVVVMAPSSLIGQIAEVTIEAIANYSLIGRLEGEPVPARRSA